MNGKFFATFTHMFSVTFSDVTTKLCPSRKFHEKFKKKILDFFSNLVSRNLRKISGWTLGPHPIACQTKKAAFADKK
jgi:hypothetical protein